MGEEEDRGQMVMRRERWMQGGGGWRREAAGCHVQPAGAGAHGNKMEISAGFCSLSKTTISSYLDLNQSLSFLVVCYLI